MAAERTEAGSHQWTYRPGGVLTTMHYGYGRRTTVPPLVVCSRCGVSQPMADHMSWHPCRAALATQEPTP